MSMQLILLEFSNLHARKAEVLSVSVLKVLCLYVSEGACFHLFLQSGHCLGRRVSVCDRGRCQDMTKCNSSERSDEMRGLKVVTVVVRVGNASGLKVRKQVCGTCSFTMNKVASVKVNHMKM